MQMQNADGLSRRQFVRHAVNFTLGTTLMSWCARQRESCAQDSAQAVGTGDSPDSILPRILVSAHRGGGRGSAPDNTPDNVQQGVELGVTAAELDVIATTDGAKFLKLGVDALMCDAPRKVLAAVEDLLGPERLPKRGEMIAELFAQRRMPR